MKDLSNPTITNIKLMKIRLIIFTAIISQLLLGHSYAAGVFKLRSDDVAANKRIIEKHVFNGFGCSGGNISPQLSWQNAPKNTKSFAITVYDPDAPTGSGWWHWLVANIPADTDALAADFNKEDKAKLENGIVQVRNDFGTYKFGGPCPPKGDRPHRYIFTVYALKTDKLDLNENSSAALAGFMINQNSLARSSFTAYYNR